jgi:hypothetical protein
MAGLLLLGAAPAADRGIAIKARPVPLAENLAVGDVADRIRFLGMLALPNLNANGLRFAQLSDLAWDEDAGLLYAISDKGALFHLQPVLRDGALVDVRLIKAVPLRDLKSRKPLRSQYADAEGLEILNGNNGRADDAELLVSFERHPRLARFRPDGYAISEHQLPAALRDGKAYVDANKGLEAVCHDAAFGTLTVPEAPLETEPPGFHRLYSTTGASWRYTAENQNRVVGLACLGGGEVIVLERDYGRVFWHSSIALKRLRLAGARVDAALTVENIATLDTSEGYQIDNFEGIARHRGQRYFLISDDNDLFIQRTLLLYIEVLDK